MIAFSGWNGLILSAALVVIENEWIEQGSVSTHIFLYWFVVLFGDSEKRIFIIYLCGIR